MNTLLQKTSRMPHHTDLRLVFGALGGRQREFNWLLTDWELNYYPPALAFRAEGGSKSSARWFRGVELTEIVNAYDIQFIWGIVSGFQPGIPIDPASLETYPFADGNRLLWSPGVTIQHPLADVEIVCWDATATMLLAADDDLTTRFRTYFRDAVDLNEYDRRISSQ